MSKGINKWIGIGNCCVDPEVKYSPSGGAVTNITVACNSSYKNKTTGEMVDSPEFVRVVFFSRLAEIAKEYLRKGSKVYIEGRLQTRKWQDKDGNDRWSTEIIASDMQMLGGKSEARENSSTPQERTATQQRNDPSPGDDWNDDLSDLPF